MSYLVGVRYGTTEEDQIELGLELQWLTPEEKKIDLQQGLQKVEFTQRHLVFAEQKFYRGHWAWVRIRLR